MPRSASKLKPSRYGRRVNAWRTRSSIKPCDGAERIFGGGPGGGFVFLEHLQHRPEEEKEQQRERNGQHDGRMQSRPHQVEREAQEDEERKHAAIFAGSVAV